MFYYSTTIGIVSFSCTNVSCPALELTRASSFA